jgi:hypothetical protein
VVDATARRQLLLGSVLAQAEIKCGLEQAPLALRVALLAQPRLTKRRRLVGYSVDKPEHYSSPVAILPNADGQALGALPLVVFSIANIGSNLSSRGNNTPLTMWCTLDPISGDSCKLSQLLDQWTLVYPRGCAGPLDVARLWTPASACYSLYLCPIGDRTIRQNAKHQEQRRRSAALKRAERELLRAGNAKPRSGETDTIWLPPDDAVANAPQLGELAELGFEELDAAMDVDAPLAAAAAGIVLPFDTHGEQVLTPAAPAHRSEGEDRPVQQSHNHHHEPAQEEEPKVQEPAAQERVQLAVEEQVDAAPTNDDDDQQQHQIQTRLRSRRHRTPTKRFAPY